MTSETKQLSPGAVADLEEVDPRDSSTLEKLMRSRIHFARDVVEDIRAGLPGACACALPRCQGPAAHWAPRPMIPSSSPAAYQNQRRLADNVSRLGTLIFVAEVLGRLEVPPAPPEFVERWTRARWHCGPFPEDPSKHSGFVQKHVYGSEYKSC